MAIQNSSLVNRKIHNPSTRDDLVHARVNAELDIDFTKIQVGAIEASFDISEAIEKEHAWLLWYEELQLAFAFCLAVATASGPRSQCPASLNDACECFSIALAR